MDLSHSLKRTAACGGTSRASAGVPTLRVAELLLNGAVHISDDDGGRVSVGVPQLVPRRLHRLAVASPGREELDEGVLARSEHLVPRNRRSAGGGGIIPP